MKISKRLRAISEFIPDNSFILDIGCDHALLDIYAVKTKKNIKAIASDINEKPLKSAKENIKKQGLNKKIKTVLKDGLDSYENGVDTVILSGLGTTTIIDILEKGKENLIDIKRIIISSNNDYLKLRKSVSNLGFYIKDETIILDKDKYYPIIVFEKGIKKYKDLEYKYGPMLLKDNSDIFKSYLKQNKKKLINIYNNLSSKYLIKKLKIKKEIKFINKHI